MKKSLYILLAVFMGTLYSCTDDLNQSPHEETTSESVYTLSLIHI